MKRVICELGVAIYLLTVPAGTYFCLCSDNTGYPTKRGGLLVFVLFLIGFFLYWLVARQTPGPDSPSPNDGNRHE